MRLAGGWINISGVLAGLCVSPSPIIPNRISVGMISIPLQAGNRGFDVHAFVHNAHERLCHRGRCFVLNYVPAVNDAFGALLP